MYWIYLLCYNFFDFLLTNFAFTLFFVPKNSNVFTTTNMFFIICNPADYDCHLILNSSGSFTERQLLFRKYISYFVLMIAFAFRENKKFGKFIYLSSYSFTFFLRSFFFLMTVSIVSWHARIATFNCHKTVIKYVSFSSNINTSHIPSIYLSLVRRSNLKLDGRLTFLVIEGDLNFEERLKFFSTLRGLLHSVFLIFWKKKEGLLVLE